MVDNHFKYQYKARNTDSNHTDDDVIAIDDESQRSQSQHNTDEQLNSTRTNNLQILINELIQEDYKHCLSKMIVNDKSHATDIIEINNEVDGSPEDIESCSLCRKSFINKNPKMLTCLHTYCAYCLPRLLTKINSSKSE